MKDYSLSKNQKEGLNWLKKIISHEHFHIWNGMKISFEPTEDYVRWFMEGFTEYYAFTLNLRANLMDTSEYLEKFNSIILQYSSSPVRNATDKEVQELFWENGDIQRLPYTKGCLLALYWDWKIRSQTLGTLSLDDVMRNLLKEMQKREHLPFSQKELQIFLGQQIDNADQDIEKYIINGETLPLESAAFDLR
jgi:predicted metalloprotease with PDZ domain